MYTGPCPSVIEFIFLPRITRRKCSSIIWNNWLALYTLPGDRRHLIHLIIRHDAYKIMLWLRHRFRLEQTLSNIDCILPEAILFCRMNRGSFVTYSKRLHQLKEHFRNVSPSVHFDGYRIWLLKETFQSDGSSWKFPIRSLSNINIIGGRMGSTYKVNRCTRYMYDTHYGFLNIINELEWENRHPYKQCCNETFLFHSTIHCALPNCNVLFTY